VYIVSLFYNSILIFNQIIKINFTTYNYLIKLITKTKINYYGLRVNEGENLGFFLFLVITHTLSHGLIKRIRQLIVFMIYLFSSLVGFYPI